MKKGLLTGFAIAMLGFSAVSEAQSGDTPEQKLSWLSTEIGLLLKKDQPPLFAWHLRSLKALAISEYSKLVVEVPQSERQSVADRTKEFNEFVGAITTGLKDYCSDPDLYLKEGKRGLVLARPSAIDGSLQYMMVGLPKDWDPNKAYPLFVSLHGSGPDNPLAYPSYGFGPDTPPKADAPVDATSGMIHLTPWGRGNRGWRNDAETDLLEALRLLKTFCKVDPDRMYITGHSSGADGCWAILQHMPDVWAAGGLQSGSMVSGRPEWGLIPNMSYVPVYFLIGEKDPLPGRVPDMKEAYQIMTKLGDDTRLVILPGIGHYPLTDQGLADQAAWMVSHVRTRPAKFAFTVDQAAHPGVWGIRVPFNQGLSRLVKEPWPHFECEIKGQEVHIKTKNIKSLNVDLGHNGLQMSGDVKLFVNGKQIVNGPVPTTVVVIKRV
jgi:pimeloyl-ACP methyl ester carboxylesterase